MLRKIIAPTISAFLLILAFPRFNLQLLAWIALIPLFFALEDKNPKQRFITGYAFGIIFFSGILYWLVNVSWPGAIIVVLISASFLAIFTLFYKPQALYAFISVPAAWAAAEYLRTHFFTGFPWALLGYSQSSNLPVIQIANITGPYGVSFLVVLANFVIYLAIKKNAKKSCILFAAFVLFAAVLAYGQNELRRAYPAQNLKIAVIQGNIPQSVKWDPRYRDFIIDKYAALSKKALAESLSLVIWPETSVPGYLEDEADLKNKVANLAASGGAHFFVGNLRDKGSKFFNSATFISDEGKILESYHKIHLVPFGEFVPFGDKFHWMRNLIDKPIGDFNRGSEFTVFKLKAHKFSGLICFEDIFPGLARKFVKNGANFLVNITNDAWFGRTSAAYQHAQGSIFRAVENRVPVVRAANTGLSCIISHTGEVLARVGSGDGELFVDGFVVETITPISARTFYTRFGDVFAWICLLGTGLILILNYLMKDLSPPNCRVKHLALVLILALTASGCSTGVKYDHNDVLVTRVIDGDTIELVGRERVRLIGIDTPEAWPSSKLERDVKRTKQDRGTIMRMGKKATEITKNLVEGKNIKLEFDVEKRDKYGRLLAYVYLPDGRMLNAELLKQGYAKLYTFPPNVKYIDVLIDAQDEARTASRGFWQK